MVDASSLLRQAGALLETETGARVVVLETWCAAHGRADCADCAVEQCRFCDESATVDCEERGMLCADCAEPHRVPCCFCGALTAWDDTYTDLCPRCCRADNE